MKENLFHQNSMGIKDFEFIKMINKGAFGRVWLVKRKGTKDFYAMKIINFLDDVIFFLKKNKFSNFYI